MSDCTASSRQKRLRRVIPHPRDPGPNRPQRVAPPMPFRWSANPYRGCVHACVYCYVFHTTTTSSAISFVKVNAPTVLREFVADGGSVDLHKDMALEVEAAIHVEGDVRRASVAVDAGVDTAAIGIGAPAEGHRWGGHG